MLKRMCATALLLGMGSWNLGAAAEVFSGLPAPKPAELSLIRYQQTHELPAEIQALIQQNGISSDQLSVYIRDLNANAPSVLYNEAVPRNPASTMKLLTTWSALKLLGPSWTWKTEAWTRGEVKDGALSGDLILKGYGDPFLTDEAFWQLLHDLRLKGLKEIHGNLVVDNSFFDLPKDATPADFDGEPSKIYNALPSALMYNFQGTRFLFEADAVGKRVNITPFPLIPGLQLDNQVTLAEGGCQKSHYFPYFQQKDGLLKVTGSYSAACGKNFILRTFSKPEAHIFDAFHDVWQAEGGTLTGTLQTGQVQAGDVLLHTQESRTLGDQIRFINKFSNNVMARELFLSVGAKMAGAPATLDKARKAIAFLLASEGIDTTGLVLENGAGLSRIEQVSVRQLGQLLETAWRDPYMPEFMASLPVLGEDGTLAERFKDDDLRGRSHMKTGTLKNVTAIAGYMLTRSGKRMVVVINGAGGTRPVQDALLKWTFEQ